MNSNEICVPSSAVGEHEEGAGDAVLPAVGDEVSVTVTGKVSRVEGGNVYFTPDTANGEPIKPAGGPMDGAEDTEASMDKMMSEEAEGMGY